MPHVKRVVVLCVILAAALIELPAVRPAAAAAAPDGEKKAASFEVYKDKAGEFRWRLRMQNTKVIASSGEGYSSKESCLKAIESVKRVAADAPVKEIEASDGSKNDADANKPANE
ncbi:MAG: uncharacterized protein QOE14_1426 [Humisphaera sp.]|nr:uncharacterized protein [Humisphaera sp.]